MRAYLFYSNLRVMFEVTVSLRLVYFLKSQRTFYAVGYPVVVPEDTGKVLVVLEAVSRSNTIHKMVRYVLSSMISLLHSPAEYQRTQSL